MATVGKPVFPKNGKFRGCGCKKHWPVCPNPSERKLGVRKERFCRKSDADAAVAKVKTDLNHGHVNVNDKTTVAEWAEVYLTRAASRVRKNTLLTYQNAVRQYIVKPLGHRTMLSLRREDLDRWIADLRASGRLSPRTIQLAAQTLKSMFKLWADYGRPLRFGNPVPEARVPVRAHPEALTVAEVQRWIDCAPEYARAMLDVEAYTGARESEIRGLREEDITFTGMDVTEPLGPQLVRLAALPDDRFEARNVLLRFERRADREGKPAPMKNARAYRSLPLTPEMAGRLGEHMTRWPPADGWIFTNPWSIRTPSRYRTAGARPWTAQAYQAMARKAAIEAGVWQRLDEHQNTHALRHHCISALLAQTIAPNDVAQWVGDTVITILRRYARTQPGADRRTMATFRQARADASTPGLRLVKPTG